MAAIFIDAMVTLCRVSRSVRPSVTNISKIASGFRITAPGLLHNRPRLDCRVCGLVGYDMAFRYSIHTGMLITIVKHKHRLR